MSEPPENVPFIWDEVLPAGGLSILEARPKDGKSTLARNLALMVVRGWPFLGRNTIQGNVVYLALEEKRDEVARHFINMSGVKEPIYTSFGRAPEDGLEALAREIFRRDAILAIVDPLFRLLRIRDANDYASVIAALEPMMALARLKGCHIMLVHHSGKLERQVGDSMLGSTALFAAVDTGVKLAKKRGKHIIESVQRYGTPIQASIITLDEPTGFIYLAGTIEEAAEVDAMERVLELLREEGPMTAPQLRLKLKFNDFSVSQALERLLEKGKVTRRGECKRGSPFIYSLLEEEE